MQYIYRNAPMRVVRLVLHWPSFECNGQFHVAFLEFQMYFLQLAPDLWTTSILLTLLNMYKM